MNFQLKSSYDTYLRVDFMQCRPYANSRQDSSIRQPALTPQKRA